MNGIVVAVNRNLGVIVVETEMRKCVVLDATGLLSLTIGEELEGDWDSPGEIIVQNLTSGGQLHVQVQTSNATLSEAVGSMTVI